MDWSTTSDAILNWRAANTEKRCGLAARLVISYDDASPGHFLPKYSAPPQVPKIGEATKLHNLFQLVLELPG